MIKGINHVAIVVNNLNEALISYNNVFGLKATKIETLPEQRVKAAIIPIGGGCVIELMQPIDATSGVAKFLENRGEGIHHIALEVENVDHELKSLVDSGVELIDKQPRSGLAGRSVFLHPKSTKGVLIELVQRV